MKNLLVLALALFTSFANASGIELRSGDVSVNLINDGKVLATKMVMNPRCPQGALCRPMYQMTVQFTLGCLNKLGPVTAQVVENRESGKYDLFMTATEIVNKASFTARCIRANTQTVTFVVPGGMDKENTNLIMAIGMVTGSVTAPVRCTREFMPVCGTKPLECPPGQICAAVMVEKTYGNKCLMKADGATLVHEGACLK